MDLGGLARTIGANYKSGYMVQSEFVPFDWEATRESANQTGRTPLQATILREQIRQSGTGVASTPTVSSTPSEEEEKATPPRFFSPREFARLQGFPEHFEIEQRNENRWYHQCGNAVSPLLVCAILERLVGVLGKVARPDLLKEDGVPNGTEEVGR